ncbi:MAG TPA: ORF6N domain-containing protein [Candidatus Caccenecus avistercoris]|nr:ORF6N domain-containing protein [Candidatus Caccenecus avistercoris]
MNELMINDINVEDLIYEVRGKQVMLDSDLAWLYKCANGTKSINLAVKRHINRFPERFIFQLTKEEYCDLKFQSETSSWDGYGGIRKLPYAFTEQGVAMLATVLRTKVAEEVSIKIMDAFVAMRKYIASNTLETRVSNIETKLIDYDHKFDLIFDKMDNEKTYHLFFNGVIYDAYSLLCDILSQAQESIAIIDNYLDKNILDVFASIQKDVLIVTKNINKKDLRNV